jgi:short-subunit dehydrogenase
VPSHLAQVNCVAQAEQLQAQLDEMTNCKVGLVVEVVSAMVIIIQHRIIVNKVNLNQG